MSTQRYTSQELHILLLNRFKTKGYEITRHFLELRDSDIQERLRVMLDSGIFTEQELMNMLYTMSFHLSKFNLIFNQTLRVYDAYLKAQMSENF